MCNLYSITRSHDAVRRLFRVGRDLTGNPPLPPAVFPDTMAPIVRVASDGWDLPPPIAVSWDSATS